MRKRRISLLVALIGMLVVWCGLAQAETALTLTAPETGTVGEDIGIHVTGLTKGDEVTLVLMDQNGRYLCGDRMNAPDAEMDYIFHGYLMHAMQNGAGTWKILVTTPRASTEKQIQMAPGLTEIPQVQVESVSFTGSAGTAVVEVKSPAGADQIYVCHALHDQTGRSVQEVEEVLPLQNGQATISAEKGADYIWTANISARLNGIWTPISAAIVMTGDHDSTYPEISLAPDAWTDPTGMTLSAPGWNGPGCLVLFLDNQMQNYHYWSFSFAEGKAEVTIPQQPKGTYRMIAGLFEENKLVAWSEPVKVTFSEGEDLPQTDYYIIDASASGTMKAGEPVSVTMSAGDGAEQFAIGVYTENDALIWLDRNLDRDAIIPGWVFNTLGTYDIVCGINSNYLERTLRVNISENEKQPSAPIFGDELIEHDGFMYIEIGTPDSTAPDGWYYEIIRDSSDWSYELGYLGEVFSSINLRADTYGPGNYRMRACQVKDGVCGPWGYTIFSYGLDEASKIIVDVADAIPFGTDYTISTAAKVVGSPVILSIMDKAAGQNVYWDVDQVNTRIFLMDGSFLAPGEYTATISIGDSLSGQKDFTITGDAPLKPELTADSLLLTGPGIVTFTVYAPGAESVYLSEGGAATESYPVTDGAAEIQVEFSQYKDGTYEFRARAKVNGTDSLWSDPVTITVQSGLPEDHQWSEVTYEWAEDGKSVTASRYSLVDESIRETETVAAGRAVLISPTETTEGQWIERSDKFRSRAFAMQVRDMGVIPALNDMKVLYLPEGIKKVDQEALMGVKCQAIIIPDGCLEIGDNAFSNNPELLYVRLPGSLVHISETAFEKCPNAVGEYR